MVTIAVFLLVVLFLAGCGAKSVGPGDEFKFKQSGRIDGVTQLDFDRVFDVSLLPTTRIQVQINGGRFLNMYEFSQAQEHFVKFGKQVTIGPGGTISYMNPPVPAAPTGTAFTVFFDN